MNKIKISTISRAKHKCPSKLATIIKRVNSLTSETNSSEWKKSFEEFYKEQTEKLVIEFDIQSFKQIELEGVLYVLNDILRFISGISRQEISNQIADFSLENLDEIILRLNKFNPQLEEESSNFPPLKLHRIIKSISPIDEIITRPPELLCRDKIKELSKQLLTELFKVNDLILPIKQILPSDLKRKLVYRLGEVTKYALFFLTLLKVSDRDLYQRNTIMHRETLQQIIKSTKDIKEQEKQNKLPLKKNFSIPIESTLEIINYTIEIVPSELHGALNKVDSTRIRACQICDRIFWANRIDSQTCSKRCQNTLRQRRYLSKNREEFNARRNANYAYKKSTQIKREKKNEP